LIEKRPPRLLVECHGVGYEVDAPMTTIWALPDLNVEVILHTHLVVREDAQSLYGFATLAERELFQSLLKVSGVGAKMALAILGLGDVFAQGAPAGGGAVTPEQRETLIKIRPKKPEEAK
jgi:Holliday junction DNA helicase RuvA